MPIGIKYEDGNGRVTSFGANPSAVFGKIGSIGNVRGKSAATSQRGGSLLHRLQSRREEEERTAKSKTIVFDEIDPRVIGEVIGENMKHGNDPDASHRTPHSHVAWQYNYLTGLTFNEKDDGEFEVIGFFRTNRMTGEGRAFETTGEAKLLLYSYKPKTSERGCFYISDGEIHNPRINIGGKTVTCTDVPDLDDVKGKVLAVKVDTSLSGYTGECWVANSLSAVEGKQMEDPAIIYLPIYKLAESGEMEEDYRNAPHVQVYEEMPDVQQ